jgi:hypothetical protein
MISKYRHIVNTVTEDIQNGKIGIGEVLPSLNELSEQFGVSRETAISAYRELKSMGLVKSNPGRGFYVASSKNTTKNHIFLFLDELTGFKEVLYSGFKDGIGQLGTVDVFFHHYNAGVYENIIRENVGNYNSYVIMPTTQKSCAPVLKAIPEGKLYIFDSGLFPYGKKYPSVCQNFEKDTIATLTSGLDLLGKYNKLILVYPDLVITQYGIIEGFKYFCGEHHFQNERIDTTVDLKPVKGECYIVIFDYDLVNVVSAAREANLVLGKDIGIISYNDTPLKRVVANGITVISTDFRLLGLTMADMVLNRRKDQIENPCYLIRRGSL